MTSVWEFRLRLEICNQNTCYRRRYHYIPALDKAYVCMFGKTFVPGIAFVLMFVADIIFIFGYVGAAVCMGVKVHAQH